MTSPTDTFIEWCQFSDLTTTQLNEMGLHTNTQLDKFIISNISAGIDVREKTSTTTTIKKITKQIPQPLLNQFSLKLYVSLWYLQ